MFYKILAPAKLIVDGHTYRPDDTIELDPDDEHDAELLEQYLGKALAPALDDARDEEE